MVCMPLQYTLYIYQSASSGFSPCRHCSTRTQEVRLSSVTEILTVNAYAPASPVRRKARLNAAPPFMPHASKRPLTKVGTSYPQGSNVDPTHCRMNIRVRKTRVSYSPRSSSSSGFRPTSESRTVSKASQLDAMLGATLSRFGVMPLYRPLKPSCRKIVCSASAILLYW